MRNKKTSNTVRFCPDVAFTLDAIPPDCIDIKPPLMDASNLDIIGINISGLLYSGGYTKNNMFGLKNDYKVIIDKVVRDLLEYTTAKILFVPHVFGPVGLDDDSFDCLENDIDACHVIMESLISDSKKRLHIVNDIYDQSEIKYIIGKCDFFVGSRMHSCIAALSQGIPAIAIAYSDKFVGVFGSIGLEEQVLDARCLDNEEISDRIIKQYEKRNSKINYLAKQIYSIRNRLNDTFKEICSIAIRK